MTSEAKAKVKDINNEAKAKDMISWPCDQGHDVWGQGHKQRGQGQGHD